MLNPRFQTTTCLLSAIELLPHDKNSIVSSSARILFSETFFFRCVVVKTISLRTLNVTDGDEISSWSETKLTHLIVPTKIV